MVRKVTAEDMLRAHGVDTTELEQAISELLVGWDALLTTKVLSYLLVAEARKLHGVQMKVWIEPKP